MDVVLSLTGIGLGTSVVSFILKKVGKEGFSVAVEFVGLGMCFYKVLPLIEDLFNELTHFMAVMGVR